MRGVAKPERKSFLCENREHSAYDPHSRFVSDRSLQRAQSSLMPTISWHWCGGKSGEWWGFPQLLAGLLTQKLANQVPWTYKLPMSWCLRVLALQILSKFMNHRGYALQGSLLHTFVGRNKREIGERGGALGGFEQIHLHPVSRAVRCPRTSQFPFPTREGGDKGARTLSEFLAPARTFLGWLLWGFCPPWVVSDSSPHQHL